MDGNKAFEFLIAMQGIYNFLSIAAFSSCYRNSKEKALRSIVNECVAAHPSLFTPCKKRPEDEAYAITDDDWPHIRKIIEAFQLHTARRYLKGELRIIKRKNAELTVKDYSMLWLYEFFCNESYKSTPLEKYMRWNSEDNGKLSDFAVAYYKLYYAVYVYCKNSEAINPGGYNYRDELFLRDILDSTHD